MPKRERFIGEAPKEREMIVRTYPMTVEYQAIEASPINREKDLHSILLRFQKNRSGHWFNVSLTNLTEEELDCVQEVVIAAFDRARPICAETDKRAQQKADEGDFTYERLYRTVPKVHRLPRRQSLHDQGVLPEPEETA